MNRPETNDPLREHEEAYYRDLWSRDNWSAATPNPDEQMRAQKIVGLIERYVRPATGGRALKILDLGCGRGWLTNILSAFGSVLGLDPVSAGVERARQLFPKLEFRVSDSSELRRENGATPFDLVVSSEVIEHVERERQNAFLQNIHALLVPGGFAILTTPRGELQEKWKRRQPEEQPLEEWISESELRRLSTGAGFSIAGSDRAFVPTNLADPISDFVHSRWFQWLARLSPNSRLLDRLRFHCAIYQVLLLQRP